VAGLDVHRDRVVVCVRLVEGGGRITTEKRSFSTMTVRIGDLAAWLVELGITTAVMESTGVYWKPIYYGLEGRVAELWLVNATHVKRVPGRKTDVSDAEWLADVAAHGMVRPSYVPPPPIRELRELTRYRATQVDARTREIQRLEKVLQDAGIKLSSVASGTWSQSARAMVEALITGERNPAVLAEMSKSRMRAKKDQLALALDGNFAAHHGVVARQVIDHLTFLDESIAHLSAAIRERLAGFEPVIELLCEIPGWGRSTAEVFIAETGGDMAVLPAPEQLASWGRCRARYSRVGRKAARRSIDDRRPLAGPSADRSGASGSPNEEHVPGSPVPSNRRPARPEPRCSRSRPHDAGHRVEHAHHRGGLPGARRGVLLPAPTMPSARPGASPANSSSSAST
jgi:transposase